MCVWYKDCFSGKQKWKLLSHVQLSLTVAHQAPLFMEFSRPEYWNGYLFPSLGDLPNPGIEPSSLRLQADSSPSESPGKPTSVERHIFHWIKWSHECTYIDYIWHLCMFSEFICILHKDGVRICMPSCFTWAQLFVTLWTIVHQALCMYMGVYRQKY